MGSHGSFEHLKHKLWAKERPGVKLAIWLLPLKVGNRPDLLGCRQRATYRWKALDESYNFASDHTSIRGLLAMLWGSKVAGIPVGGISRLPRGSPGTKSHLDVASTERHIVYYKGEGGGFPKSGPWWVKWVQGCPWLVLAPKVLQLCTNHFVRVLCNPVWMSEACQLFLVPSRSSNPPLYPSKGYELGSVPQLPLSFVVFHLDSHLSPSRSWECVNFNFQRPFIFLQTLFIWTTLLVKDLRLLSSKHLLLSC
jgi:hypothetical protein